MLDIGEHGVGSDGRSDTQSVFLPVTVREHPITIRSKDVSEMNQNLVIPAISSKGCKNSDSPD